MGPQEKAIGPGGIEGAGLVYCCHWSCGQVEGWQRGGRSPRGEAIDLARAHRGELEGGPAGEPTARSRELGVGSLEPGVSCASSPGPQRGEGRTGRWHPDARLRRRLGCGGDDSAPRALDASHSTAGFAGYSRRERLGGLQVETAATGKRRPLRQSGYPSGDPSGDSGFPGSR